MGKKKTTEQYKEEIKSLDIICLEEYINSSTKILHKCKKCGHEWKVRPNDVLNGEGCSACYGTPKKTTEQFKEEVKKITGNEYTVLGEYINNKTKILMKHDICGHEYYVTPNRLLSAKNRCPDCYGTPKKTTEQFKEEVKKIVGNEYTVLGEYVSAHTKILMKHNICGHEWKIVPNNILNGVGCPHCKTSHGEKAVEAFLTENKINYISQKTFSDCKDKRVLPFDFYLPEKNIAIEYQGIQHYKPREVFGGEKQLHKQRHHDWLKRKYCQKNNITLITIRYDENIEEKLNKVII